MKMARAKKGVATSKGQLPANVADMASGLVQSAATATAGSGQQFMKFTKFGSFEFGAEDIETEEGALFAVNPMGFGQGWIAWGDKEHGTQSEMLGEVMSSSSEAMPAQPAAVNGIWAEQRAIQLACVSGEDEGTQMLFKTSSLGGKKFYAAIVLEVVKKINAGDPEIVPIITLEAESYQHAKYGKIFTPTFTVKSWQTMAEQTVASNDESSEEEEPEEAPAPTRRKRRASAA